MGKKERIELHCHSKAGGNAMMYAGEVISYLNDQGIEGVAITDTSSIMAFPEIESIWNTGNYTTKSIFGMEMLINCEQDDERSVSVLIKNEEGKKNLYQLVNQADGTRRYPVFEFQEIINHRDGLLIGSGAYTGILYRKAAEGCSDEELREVIREFDYIEVLPDIALRDITRRVISLSEDKIVVAVGDVHYIHKTDRKAWSILRYWMNSQEDEQKRHFYSTEEMLEAFDYLPPDKAEQIVIKNTHTIADMCAPITVRSNTRMYPEIAGAKEKLQSLCRSKLQEKYRGKDQATAKERLEMELDAIHKTGVETLVLLEWELFTKAKVRACDISMRGSASGSIVLYLLGISEIDPIKYQLCPKFIFGADGNRELDMDVNFSSEKQQEILDMASELDGVEMTVRCGCVHSISPSLATAMIEKFEEDHEVYFDDEQEKIKCQIAGNYNGRGKHKGALVLIGNKTLFENTFPIARTKDGCLTTYFDYFSVDDCLAKLDILSHPGLDMLHRLSEEAGVDLADVPPCSEETLTLFQADEKTLKLGCSDLPDFNPDFVQSIVAALKPASFEDLVKINAISHGSNSWEGNAEILVREGKAFVKDVIATRDDVLDFLLEYNIEETTAFEIAERVRKGIIARGQNSNWKSHKKMLSEAGVPEWFLWSCEQIRYLFPRSHAISYMYMNLRLGWFKIHYPEIFSRVIKEFEEMNL